MIQPRYRVKSNQVLELTRGNPFEYTYSENQALPFGTSGFLTFSNVYGQTLHTWDADADGGVLPFYGDSPDDIPTGSSWTLSVDYNDGNAPRIREQGTVVRAEAPFPNAPAGSDIFAGVQYNYSFGTPGYILDPAWRILAGRPQSYDNSGDSHPNAVAVGASLGGTYDDASLFYYAPLKTDAVRFTYTIVPSHNGDAYIVICSNYDATNFACIHHHAGTDYIAIAMGTGPTTITDQTSHVSHSVAYETFTAEYNPSSNTFSVYVGASTTPLVSWNDGSNIVHHGNGDRYVGLVLKSAGANPGVEVANWRAGDNIGV